MASTFYSLTMIPDDARDLTIIRARGQKVAVVDWSNETIHFYPDAPKTLRDLAAKSLGFPTSREETSR